MTASLFGWLQARQKDAKRQLSVVDRASQWTFNLRRGKEVRAP